MPPPPLLLLLLLLLAPATGSEGAVAVDDDVDVDVDVDVPAAVAAAARLAAIAGGNIEELGRACENDLDNAINDINALLLLLLLLLPVLLLPLVLIDDIMPLAVKAPVGDGAADLAVPVGANTLPAILTTLLLLLLPLLAPVEEDNIPLVLLLV